MTTKSEAWKKRLGEVFAERQYQLATKGRKKSKVLLRFGKPRPAPDRRGYYCVYRYTGLGDADRTRYAMGVDGLHAFYLAVQIALVELICSDAYREGRLTWEGSYDLALGFPVPDAVKDRVRNDPEPRPSARKTRRKSQ